jgi:hypothetical protein
LKKIWRNKTGNPYSYRNILKNIVRLVFKNPFPEHFDKQLPVNLNFETYTITPSRLGFIRNCQQIKNEAEPIKTNGLNSRNGEKVEDSIDEDKHIIIGQKFGKGNEKVVNSPENYQNLKREESFSDDEKKIIFH